jgi:hypothetical protein
MHTLNRMLTLAIDESSDNPDYGRALRGARIFMTATWVCVCMYVCIYI